VAATAEEQIVNPLIIGKGYIGSALATLPSAVVYPGRLEELRSEDLRECTHVINAAAKTDLAWCEANPARTHEVNGELAGRTAQVCAKAGKPLIHISSGCVWDGPYDEHDRPFRPDSPISPACVYSKSKAEGDARIQSVPDLKWAILRPRMPYDGRVHPRNLLTKLRGYERLVDTPQSVSSVGLIRRFVHRITSNDWTWNRITCIYDFGTVTPFWIGLRLALAGLRSAPRLISKAELDAGYKPKRVDTVMHDGLFEQRFHTLAAQLEIYDAICAYAIRAGGQSE